MQESDRPDDVPAKGIVVLHDPEAEKSLVVLFFENKDDYARGDAAFSAMPSSDTPGQRTSVAKYEVAFRMTGCTPRPCTSTRSPVPPKSSQPEIAWGPRILSTVPADYVRSK